MSDHHWSRLSLGGSVVNTRSSDSVGNTLVATRHSFSTSMLAPLLPLLWLLPAARGFGNMEDGTGRAELCDVRRGA